MAGAMQAQGKVGVLVVDMQLGIEKKAAEHFGTLKGRLFLRKFESVCTLVEAAMGCKAPVVLLKYEMNPNQIDDRVLRLAGGQNAIVIEKSLIDGFDNTNLASVLHEEKVSTLIVAGFNKYACAYQTARAGSEIYGFRIVSSHSILFGGKWDGTGPDPEDLGKDPAWKKGARKNISEATEFFSKKAVMLLSLDELVSLVRRNA